MFEDSLIESGGKLKTSRPATAAFSFGLQAVIVGILVLIPLLFTEALPKTQLMTFLVAPPPPPPPPPPPAAVKVVKKIETEIVNNQLRTPTKIPKKVEMIKEEEPPPPSVGVVGGVPGGVPGGQMGGVIGGIISSTPVAVPKVAAPQRVRVSQGVTQGLVIHRVQPIYPQMAKIARVQGPVVLAAIIGKDGTIQNLHVLSTASPLLNQAALDAVKQWRYRPYILNGEPVEVDTQITVNFTLSGA
ncbi:MAG: TonB family protein [Acidobacteria bacterium]|nr:TonB family protein [Acidobacteriota bacterium]MBV9625813.1 TonB family protein [Acidobacteriota bacterium]